MVKPLALKILVSLSATGILIYASYLMVDQSGKEASIYPVGDPNTSPAPEQDNSFKHPIVGKPKKDISRLFPGNCFAELYLANPSFGGKLVESCQQKTLEQIKLITGVELSSSELTSPQVISHLKMTFGINNPWRL